MSVRLAATAALFACLVGCDSLPGNPAGRHHKFVRPDEVSDFYALYALNCSGCHGEAGKFGPARSLNDPLYLAIAPTDVIEQAIRAGIEGTSMPAFASSEGGTITEAQVKILAAGLKKEWGGVGPAGLPSNLPSYRAPDRPSDRTPNRGAVARGEAGFGVFCASCHGAGGRGGEKAGSVVDPSFLGLTSDQSLRTTVIAGREDLEMPNFTGYADGRVMTEREISDVVAWLISQRPEYPGQPYPSEQASQGTL